MSAPEDNHGTTAATKTPGKAAWPVVESVHVGYLSLAHAAKYLGGVSTATVRRWVKNLGLPHYHVPGPGKGKSGGPRGTLLFRKGELDRWTRRFKDGLDR